MIQQVKFNTETINYVEVDRSKPIQSIRHRMNVKTAISGIKHHPYNSEMNFGDRDVKIIKKPKLYVVAAKEYGYIATKPFVKKKDAESFIKGIINKIECWIEVEFFNHKTLPSDLTT